MPRSIRLKLVFISALLAVFGSICSARLCSLYHHEGPTQESLLLFVLFHAFLLVSACTSLFLSLLIGYLALALPISRLNRSVYDALANFAAAIYHRITGYLYWRRLENATKRARLTQLETLRRILSRNKDTEYGRLMKFAEIKDVDEFRAKHPLSDFERFRPYIDRMETRGEQNLITAREIAVFFPTSGTTGKPKQIPAATDGGGLFREFNQNYLPLVLPSKPYLAPVRTLFLIYTPAPIFTPCGMLIGAATATCEKRTFHWRNWEFISTTPKEVTPPMPVKAETYIHLLFALYDTELRTINAVFGGSVFGVFAFLAEYWKKFSQDIRTGSINDNFLGIPSDVVEKIPKFLPADPNRADEIERQFGLGMNGIASRVWPNLQALFTIVSGGNKVTIEPLRYYLGPKVLIHSYEYGMSECGVPGVNTDHPFLTGKPPNPKTPDGRFTIVPNMGSFFEFIPIDGTEEEKLNTVLIDELKVGCRYELVSTSDASGLYRYRIGDILKVVDFHNQAPVVEFCGRVGNLLDLRSEKVSEDMVLSALKSTKWHGYGRLVDFSASESVTLQTVLLKTGRTWPVVDSAKGGLYHIIFVEVEGLERQLTDDESAIYDKQLRNVGQLYDFARDNHGLGMPKVIAVAKGAFEALKAFILQRNRGSPNQYKTPRYVTNVDLVSFLLDQALPQSPS